MYSRQLFGCIQKLRKTSYKNKFKKNNNDIMY
jgi:hypothetical protein